MPFQQGKSGNPKGRPRKGQTVTEALRKYMESSRKLPWPGFTDKTAKQALIEQLAKLALQEKDLGAMKYIFDRLDGSPAQTVRQEIEGKNMPIIILDQPSLFTEEELEDLEARLGEEKGGDDTEGQPDNLEAAPEAVNGD
jgi:preprotein translocase subunit SecD